MKNKTNETEFIGLRTGEGAHFMTGVSPLHDDAILVTQ